MALSPGFLDELRSRVSIAAVVGRKVTWDSRKSNAARGDYWAPCPFHQEKTASFHVEEAKGRYHCFGCHAGGDVVSFLRETENLGFIEAVERLAVEAGMEMPVRDAAAAARAVANQGLVEAMEAAVRFYRAQLNGARAGEARAYLQRRGLTPAALERFEIGYAPEARTDLLAHLEAKGFARERLAEAGLVGLPKDGGGAYDRFRHRIVFPIRDGRGRAVAFGARAVAAGQEPKYLNSPETPLFDKSRTLYNLGPARAAAAKAGTLVVAEGYMDVIALAEAGIGNAVAPLGTAITEAQLAALWKLAPEPVIALDGDAAGLAAAQRLIDLALPLVGPARSLRFALLPPGQDPDDVVRTGGAPAMRAILDASQPMVALVWDRETSGQPLDSPERRAALDARLKAHVARIADAGLRKHWEREVHTRTSALFSQSNRAPQPVRGWRLNGSSKPSARPKAGAQSPVVTVSAKGSLLVRGADAQVDTRVRESAILTGCLNHPGVALAMEGRLERLTFLCPDLGVIRDALVAEVGKSPDRESLLTAISARLGHDPLPGLTACGPVRANRHLQADADPELAARAIDEELTRHAARTGRADEIREAVVDLLSNDDRLTLRVRAAGEAEQVANTKPLEDNTDAAEAEHREFAAFVRVPDPRGPRKH
jgi:DNA primase